MNDKIKSYAEVHKTQMFDTLKELCAIPAPSYLEHQRAAYCKAWLEAVGATNVYIDEALNVIFPLGCENSSEITVFAAHTDTVFPDTEPMPYFDDGERIHCPGVSDDTASVTVLMLMAKFFIENRLLPQKGILFVCNSCEEGLGNLKGVKHLFKSYAGRISRFISFDSSLNSVVDGCVGSHRYEVEVLTEGGHSFSAFGKPNAIAALSKIVNEIYKIEVPEKEGVRTTYNVGTVSGGTSVNTIAQNAKMLCEYRSDDLECLAVMQAKFKDIFEKANTEDVSVRVTPVGERPCGNIDREKVESFKALCVPVIEEVIGQKVAFKSASTDCNVPLSMGIAALCLGVDIHSGTHTREEWVDKASLVLGLEMAIKLGVKLAEVTL